MMLLTPVPGSCDATGNSQIDEIKVNTKIQKFITSMMAKTTVSYFLRKLILKSETNIIAPYRLLNSKDLINVFTERPGIFLRLKKRSYIMLLVAMDIGNRSEAIIKTGTTSTHVRDLFRCIACLLTFITRVAFFLIYRITAVPNSNFSISIMYLITIC
jgi:hypothetical protein